MITTARNATLEDLTSILREQDARKIDMVLPAKALTAADGNLHVHGADPLVEDDGVTLVDGMYHPTSVCDEGLADKLGIPIGYLRKLRSEHVDLYDANVNGWLDKKSGNHYLLRAFRSMGSEDGVARAFLSDRFGLGMDNFDMLVSALDGVRAAGVEVRIDGADLSERRMVVRLVCEEIKAYSSVLMRGYRSPFTGMTGEDNPTVFAGLQFSNSETGDGAWTVAPRLVFKICNNGATITKDVIRSVHLGGRLEAGVIKWSEQTQRQAAELVRSKTADAVRTFLDVDYVTRALAGLEEKAEVPVETDKEVRVIVKQAKYTEEQADGILAHFMRQGQMTRGGIFNAATAYAQTVEDPDAAFEVEQNAGRLLGV